MAHRFRFGVNLLEPARGEAWERKCRRVEELGYDVLQVPDHLDWPAPFPSLVAAAHATRRPRLGTFVLNTAFWNPVLLAREVATTARLTGGRLELGLGAGYVRAEFERAGLAYGTARDRVDHLERTVEALTGVLPGQGGADGRDGAGVPLPPLLLGGNGPRMLRLAARHAAVVAFTGAEADPAMDDGSLRLLSAAAVEERVAIARGFAAEYGTDPDFNVLVQRVVVTGDRAAAVRELAPHAPHLDEEELLDLPTLLVGTVTEIAEQLRRGRERFGFGYVTVLEPAMEAFAPVIAELRRGEEPGMGHGVS
ncbi:TIGR03621 family F420-dependent LLM class oxidoreductase [Actinacidiphila glaucinigra]|uniref:TIGR03621 family F420-dependent LLM class oxidoreductase n=1 Tax=Actinacidiphila glaucinigra TaxID=235986 RepID=UPI002DD89D24|nr:TIGR03621 family F420-dependent LLM class oxidoreductase [Actinacidiphila glaucinigra]WSD63619.1 TIGR03621 family F420-dependent LLM class oxidoreductase [Actinacidiphila glaucinigra]